MLRDMELIRELLLHIEADDEYDGSGISVFSADLGRPPNLVRYQMKLLGDAKLVDVADWMASGEPLIRGLTWEGHEFLDSIRDPKIWHKTKDAIGKVGGFSLKLLKDIATAYLKEEIKRRTGLDF
jgi:Hypothetical protein (DUF2513)